MLQEITAELFWRDYIIAINRPPRLDDEELSVRIEFTSAWRYHLNDRYGERNVSDRNVPRRRFYRWTEAVADGVRRREFTPYVETFMWVDYGPAISDSCYYIGEDGEMMCNGSC